MNRIRALICVSTVVFSAGCSHPGPQPITIGALASTERILIAEIAAQHVEKRLGVTVDRRLDLGSTSLAYDGLVLGTTDVYPEDTNALVVSVLKEPLDPDPAIVLNRVRNELPRLGRVQVLDPLGIRQRVSMAVRASDAKDGKMQKLSEAARSRLAWTLGCTSDFEQRTDGYSVLMRTYNLPLKLAPKVLPPRGLYEALASNQASMVAGYDTDGPLAGPEFTVLNDDKNAFQESRACLLVRQGAVERTPGLRAALDQLSRKFNNETMRKMNYEVDVEKAHVGAVAAEFLRQAGL